MKSTVVVGYDQTPHSDAALAEAAREAVWRGADLNVVTVFSRPATFGPTVPLTSESDSQDAARKAAEAVVQHGVDRVRERHPGLQARPQALVGSAGKTMAQVAHGADLLVLGSRGQGGFAGLQMGSTSMRALADACCPVLVVRGEVDEDESGRGLMLVEALAQAWGTRPSSGGKTVWCTVSPAQR